MKRQSCKQILSILMTLLLTCSLLPLGAMASLSASAKDLDGHPAALAIETLHSYGIMNGDGNGVFAPGREITRAEFASLVNKAFGYDTLDVPEADGYTDIPADKWYAAHMHTAIALRYIVGYGNGRAGPEDKITREQAQIIFSKILRRPDYAIPFPDKTPLTRGDAAVLLLDVFGAIAEGDFDAEGGQYSGSLTIRKPGTVLKNAVIKGDLYISEGVGDGDIWLENVDIGGRLLVAGGGGFSIHAKDVTVSENVLVDKPAVAGEQPVRFVFTQHNGATVVLNGTVREIVITGDIVVVVGNEGETTVFNLLETEDETAKPSVTVSENATVDKISVFIPAEIGGDGSVGHIEANTGGIVIESTLNIDPADVTVDGSVEVVVDGDGNVVGTVDNETETEPPPPPPPPPQDGSQGGGSQPDAVVTALSVKTQPTALTYVHGGALDLSGLTVTLTYDNGSTEDVTLSGFAAKNITAAPANGAALSRPNHDGQPVAVSFGTFSANTSNLTVNPAPLGIDTVEALAKTFDGTGTATAGTVTFTGLVGGESLTADTDYTVSAEFTGGSYSAGSAKPYTYTVTMENTAAAGNYTLAVNTKTGNDGVISKASGLTATPPNNITINNTDTAQHGFDLGGVALSQTNYGTRGYALGAFADPSDILESAPSLTGGSTLNYQGAGKSSGEATQTVIISTTNYEDVSVTVTFAASAKTDVSGSIVFTDGSEEYARAEFTHETATYNGSGDNITYTYAAVTGTLGPNGKPYRAGTYTVTATYEDADNWGSKTVDFTVTPKALTVINTAVNNKPYDGTNTAKFITPPALSGVISGDTVTLSTGVPTFASIGPANGIAINFTPTFGGDDADNYYLGTQPFVTANITQGFTPVKGTHYTATTLNGAGWTNSDFVITASSGYEISLTNTAAGTWASSLTLSAETDFGSVPFYLRNTATGEISVAATETYKLDKTAPEGEITIKSKTFREFLNAITFNLFFKSTQAVDVFSTDNFSAAPTIEYLLSAVYLPDSTDWSAQTWTPCVSGFYLPQNWKGVVYARITDDAGNFTVITSEGVVVYTDSAAGTATISHTKFSGDKSATVTLYGNTIAKISNYTTNTTLSADIHYIVAAGTITFMGTYLDSLVVSAYTLTVHYNPRGEAYVAHTDNDEPATTAITLNVYKAGEKAVSGAPTVSGTPTQDSITVNAVTISGTNPGNQTVEYAITTTNSPTPASGWQSSTTFTGLTADTTYYVFARSAENDDCEAGPAQVSAAIRTAAEEDPSLRRVVVDFESDAVGKTYPFTRGNNSPTVEVAADPVAGSEKSLQITTGGASSRWNQAAIVPIHLPYDLASYKEVSFRLYWMSGTASANVSAYASDSPGETDNFLQYGFGNESSSQYHFASRLVGRSAVIANTVEWTDYTITIGTLDDIIKDLKGNVHIAIGIHVDANISYLLDDITFTLNDDFVLPDPGAAVGAPTLNTKASRNISINAVAVPSTGQTVEYGISTTGTPPSAWQDGLTFSGLTADTQYYIFARSKANDDFRAGAPSTALEVKTDEETAPEPAALGAAETGVYRNMLAEFGFSDADIDAKLQQTYDRLFNGADGGGYQIYVEVDSDMAYIHAVDSDDVRSEGMSYGMMMALQMDDQEKFDRLWKWAYTHMRHESGNNRGYFAWRCGTGGNKMDDNPAPDGEYYFATALLFASNRWGDKEGIFNYGREGRTILYDIINRKSGEHKALFELELKIPIFSPMTTPLYTDASYHLPAFFDIWAEEIIYGERYWDIWGGDEFAVMKDAAFYRDAAEACREWLRTKGTHSETGLSSEYAQFDGTPGGNAGLTGQSALFAYDSWRTAMNIALDYSWWAKAPWQTTHANKIQAFFAQPEVNPSGKFSYGNIWNVDGTPSLDVPSTGHSPGLIGANAAASLAATDPLAWDFVEYFWNTGMTSGTYRYYDGCLYMFSMLKLSGNYKAYYSTGPGDGSIPRITPLVAAFDKADPDDIPVTVRWNGGNTLEDISDGAGTLTEGTDYTVSGDEVTLKADYLQTLPIGTARLTFEFSEGTKRTLSVLIDDTSILILGRTFETRVPFEYTPVDNPLTASFPAGEDVLRIVKTTSHSSAGVALPFRLAGSTLADYTTSRNLYIEITAIDAISNQTLMTDVYLSGQSISAMGSAPLTANKPFSLSAGATETHTLPITVSNPQNFTGDIWIAFGLNIASSYAYDITYIGLVPKGEVATPSASISPTNATFDKANPQNIPVTITPNGNSFTEITGLTENTDYTVSGNTVTLLTSYLTTLTVTTNLTFTFSPGADRTFTVNVTDSSVQNSSISPTSADFDKHEPAVVSTDMTLNGNTLTAIKTVAATLEDGTDYDISGDTVTFTVEFLETLDLGANALTFEFSAGATQTFTVTVSDSTPQVGPTIGLSYDFSENIMSLVEFNSNKHANTKAEQLATGTGSESNVLQVVVGAARDVIVLPFNLGSTTLADYTGIEVRLLGVGTSYKPFSAAISSGGALGTFGSLTSNTRITANFGSAIENQNTWKTITMPITLDATTASGISGNVKIGFGMDDGSSGVTYQISEIRLIPDPLAIPNASITPTTATFDKDAPADVAVTMTLNDNTLTEIKNGGTTLTPDADYTVSGGTVTIKEDYLSQQNVGTTTLTFVFTPGNDATLAITVTDSNAPPPERVLAYGGDGGKPFDDSIAWTSTTGGNVTASFPGGNVMRVNYTGGYNDRGNGIILLFDLGNTNLTDYSHFRIVTRPSSGDLGSKNFHVEVYKTVAEFGSSGIGATANTTVRLVNSASHNFSNNPLTLNLPITNTRTDLTGEIYIGFGLHNTNPHTYDVVSIELVPKVGGSAFSVAPAMFALDRNSGNARLFSGGPSSEPRKEPSDELPESYTAE